MQTGFAFAFAFAEKTHLLSKVNERALRYVYKDKTSAYYELLQRIGLGTTLEKRADFFPRLK